MHHQAATIAVRSKWNRQLSRRYFYMKDSSVVIVVIYFHKTKPKLKMYCVPSFTFESLWGVISGLKNTSLSLSMENILLSHIKLPPLYLPKCKLSLKCRLFSTGSVCQGNQPYFGILIMWKSMPHLENIVLTKYLVFCLPFFQFIVKREAAG